MIWLAFLLIFWTAEDPNKHKKPLENPDPWDHAQMIERTILFRIALTRALYDQIRPEFFQKYGPDLYPEVYFFFCGFLTPGDRAQKVIPGGAKANESF